MKKIQTKTSRNFSKYQNFSNTKCQEMLPDPRDSESCSEPSCSAIPGLATSMSPSAAPAPLTPRSVKVVIFRLVYNKLCKSDLVKLSWNIEIPSKNSIYHDLSKRDHVAQTWVFLEPKIPEAWGALIAAFWKLMKPTWIPKICVSSAPAKPSCFCTYMPRQSDKIMQIPTGNWIFCNWKNAFAPREHLEMRNFLPRGVWRKTGCAVTSLILSHVILPDAINNWLTKVIKQPSTACCACLILEPSLKERLARQTSPQTPKNLVKWLIWMGIGWASCRKGWRFLEGRKPQRNWFWFLLIDVESRSQKGFSYLLESFFRLQICQFWFNLNRNRNNHSSVEYRATEYFRQTGV